MTLRNVRIESKGEKPRYMDKDIFDKSSDVTVFNLYEQDWPTLVDNGLSHIFNENESEFEQRKSSITEVITEIFDEQEGEAVDVG